MGNKNIYTINLSTLTSANSLAISTSGTLTMKSIDLNVYKPEGFFALTLSSTTTGGGSVKAEYLVSADNSTFQEPVGASDIFSTHTSSATSNYSSFEPPVARYLQLKFTEDGGGPVTIGGYLTIQ